MAFVELVSEDSCSAKSGCNPASADILSILSKLRDRGNYSSFRRIRYVVFVLVFHQRLLEC